MQLCSMIWCVCVLPGSADGVGIPHTQRKCEHHCLFNHSLSFLLPVDCDHGYFYAISIWVHVVHGCAGRHSKVRRCHKCHPLNFIIEYCNTRIAYIMGIYVGFPVRCLPCPCEPFDSPSGLLCQCIINLSMMYFFGFFCTEQLIATLFWISELPQNRQGHLQGAIDSLLSLASALGSATMVATFFILIWDDETGAYLPEGTFYLATLFALASWGFSTLAVYHAGNDKLALEEMSSIVKPVDTLQVLKTYETKQHQSSYPA